MKSIFDMYCVKSVMFKPRPSIRSDCEMSRESVLRSGESMSSWRVQFTSRL